MKIHVVKEGETLSAIARKHGVSLEEILRANPDIRDPDVIRPGMKIRIPAAPPPAYELMHKHTVQQGDTLWKLAKAWGVPLADMIKANPQLKNPNALMTGEIVNIPKVPAGGQMPQAGDTGGAQGMADGIGGAGFHSAHGKPDTWGKKSTAPLPEAPMPQMPPPDTEAPELPPSAPEYPAPEMPKVSGEYESYADLFKMMPIPPLEAMAPPGPHMHPPKGPCPPDHYPYPPHAPHGYGWPQPVWPLSAAPEWPKGKSGCGCGGTGGTGGHPAQAGAAETYPGLGAGWPWPMTETQPWPIPSHHPLQEPHPSLYPCAQPYMQQPYIQPQVQPYPQSHTPAYVQLHVQPHPQPYAQPHLQSPFSQPHRPQDPFALPYATHQPPLSTFPFQSLPHVPIQAQPYAVPYSPFPVWSPPFGRPGDADAWPPGGPLQPAGDAVHPFGTGAPDADGASGRPAEAAVSGADAGADGAAGRNGAGGAAKAERPPERTGETEKDAGKPAKGKLKTHAVPAKEAPRRKRSNPWTRR